jgi:predicted PurR-regulated permease PerM
VQVPGSIVLIAALAGGTLAGLPGALVAIPAAAGILLILKEIVIPAKARS